jgi:hypothetical protein
MRLKIFKKELKADFINFAIFNIGNSFFAVILYIVILIITTLKDNDSGKGEKQQNEKI